MVSIIDDLTVVGYRVAAVAYYQRSLSAIGARDYSGRFNRLGVSALYFATEADTAIAEYWGSDPLRPAVVIPVELRLRSVIDLHAPSVAPSGIWANWDCDWKAARDAPKTIPPADCASWQCGDDVTNRNCSAIRFPSTKRPGGVNIVVYPENALIGDCLIIPFDPLREIAAVHPAKA